MLTLTHPDWPWIVLAVLLNDDVPVPGVTSWHCVHWTVSVHFHSFHPLCCRWQTSVHSLRHCFCRRTEFNQTQSPMWSQYGCPLLNRYFHVAAEPESRERIGFIVQRCIVSTTSADSEYFVDSTGCQSLCHQNEPQLDAVVVSPAAYSGICQIAVCVYSDADLQEESCILMHCLWCFPIRLLFHLFLIELLRFGFISLVLSLFFLCLLSSLYALSLDAMDVLDEMSTK